MHLTFLINNKCCVLSTTKILSLMILKYCQQNKNIICTCNNITFVVLNFLRCLNVQVHFFVLEMAAPACPPLKDLPKVAGDFKSELEGFKTTCLKNADTQEKIILPTAEGM